MALLWLQSLVIIVLLMEARTLRREQTGESVTIDLERDLAARIASIVQLYGSRAAAAEAAGVSRDQISRYIQGRSGAGFDALARLAKGRGVSLDWLATGTGPMLVQDRGSSKSTSASPAEDDTITPELIQAVALYWLLANHILDQSRSAEELSRIIADQCELMRGEESAARFFVENLKSKIEDIGRKAHEPSGRNHVSKL